MKGTTIRRPARTLAAAVPTLLLPLAACSQTPSNDTSQAGATTITVTSTDSACDVSVSKVPAGNLVFKVVNRGSKVTEFYLYGEDNVRIVGEVENIGPGLSRQLVVRAPAGSYHTACKPGMVGKGLRADFSVTGSSRAASIKGVEQGAIVQATGQYAAYVRDQSEQLLGGAARFAAAYRQRDNAKARALYPVAREHWERIEPVAESFGDLDPKIDLREANLSQGQKWTGWHRIEKDLWPPRGYRSLGADQRAFYAADLIRNLTTLDRRVHHLAYTVDQIGNGAKSLLDEVATSKITGEEEVWSHTDLYDFQANVEGSRAGFKALKPLLKAKDPALATTLQERFSALRKLLAMHRTRQGFVSYDTVTPAERRKLSDAVNALAEPLSKVTGAITL